MKFLFDKLIPSFMKRPLKTHYLGKLYQKTYDNKIGWKYFHIGYQFVKLDYPTSSPSIWECSGKTIFETTSLEEALFRISVLGILDENIQVDDRIHGYDWLAGPFNKN